MRSKPTESVVLNAAPNSGGAKRITKSSRAVFRELFCITSVTALPVRQMALQYVFQYEFIERHGFHKIGGAEYDVVEFRKVEHVRF